MDALYASKLSISSSFLSTPEAARRGEYDVSYLQKASNLASISEQTSAPATASKSSFPMDAYTVSKSHVSKPSLSAPEAARRDEYEDLSYDMQSAQWLQVNGFFTHSSRVIVADNSIVTLLYFLHSFCHGD